MISAAQFRAFLKAAEEEFAPGIPAERRIEPLPQVKRPQQWTLAVQRHHARRAGEHLDLRLVDPRGKAHSWAIPQAKLPRPGEQAVWAIPQPTHTGEYATTAGKDKTYTIPEGYGAGKVKMEKLVPAEVYHVEDQVEPNRTRVRFNTYDSDGPQEYAIVKTKDGREIVVNKTMHRKRLQHLPLGEKPKLRSTTPGSIDPSRKDEVMMPKYDGAHTILDLSAPGRIGRIFSYRLPKRHRESGVIEHTHKVPKLLKKKVPEELKGTVLRSELIGIDKSTGQALHGTEIGRLLNSAVEKSREQQKLRHEELVPIALDVLRYKGRDVSDKPFSERYEMLREVRKLMGLKIPEVARTEKQKTELIDRVRRGEHPMTTEGVVLRRDDQPHAVKAKFRPDHDVYVREIFPAQTTRTGDVRAGGFRYSHTPRGKIVGSVGTGLDHTTLKDMLENPGRYVGRTAKVTAEKKMRSGALSKPSFEEWHLDKGTFVEQG